ncbi:ATP-binding protein [Leucothrix arctica]|uniref:histidine kinase n=1 Tax=Leucothrix arctica TaxID=1481894 RepID=A0A317C4K0_9GAMM|nr:ATP-binding protein [Leucothrix arctica]PWQ93534.1 hypothetical protein DKT75_18110 [Leucothrix arctica]
MIKLFFTLTVMVLLPIIIYVLSINGTVNFLLKDTLNNYQQRVSKGTVTLLNQSVRGLDQNQRLQKLNELQNEFIYPLKLAPFTDYNFDKHDLKRLDHGLTVGIETDDVTTLFARLPESDLIWVFDMDQDYPTDEANTAAGTMYLIEQQLLEHTLAVRPQVLKEIRANFGFDLLLEPIESVTFTEQQLARLEQGKVLPISDGKEEYHLYKKVSDSPWLLVVPSFQSPWIARHLSTFIIISLLMFVSLFVLFWVWTLWRDLARLQQAAKAFGSGDYEARVPYRKSARLSSLNYAFNQMAARTQASIRSHKELTSAVSHELRTPIARMRFSLDMLETTDEPADHQRYVDNMNQDMEELDTLLNELLTYARFDQTDKRLEPKLQPLKPWFESTMQGFEGLSGGIDLTWQSEAVSNNELASFDDVLMSRLLSNLVQNSFRHAETKVHATLSYNTEHVTLLVDDDGAGIPESERERLFEAFAIQDSSRNKNGNGFGLGLAIVKRVVTAHQGQVEIHDSRLGGAQLLVRWPTNLSIETENKV